MTTITPESIFNGRIVIVDLPINDFHDGGLLVQAAWKYLFQRAVLSRPDQSRGAKCRPVFLWEDEAQIFLIENDELFQPVAREYRVACVKLSQNISNFHARFGGGQAATSKVDAIIGSLNTKIFHANGDMATNEYASKLIGTEQKTIVTNSTTRHPYNGLDPLKELAHNLFNKPVETTNEHVVREPIIHPHDFTGMQTGNEGNGFSTMVVMTQVGRTFGDGKRFAITFIQQQKLT